MITINRFGRRSAALLATATATAALVAAAAPTADAAAVPRATARDISITVRPIPNPSAGATYVDLDYRNVSKHPVSIRGYSGLSFVAHGNGTMIGEPARWLTNRRAVRVVLKPGQSARQIITIANTADYGSTKHHTVRTDGFRVYLPGSRAAIFVPYRTTATTRHVAQLEEDPIGARI